MSVECEKFMRRVIAGTVRTQLGIQIAGSFEPRGQYGVARPEVCEANSPPEHARLPEGLHATYGTLSIARSNPRSRQPLRV